MARTRPTLLPPRPLALSLVALLVNERASGNHDVNGDGDAIDSVLVVTVLR